MASKVTVESINKARDAVSRGEDIREEMMLVVIPHVSWENYLSPAPMCICLLGELMVLSTTADFTLENSPPKDGFKLMRWPSSFRASLMQVANCGYEAFSEAHTSMDQIRLLSLNVPRHLLDATKYLLKGTDQEIVDLLPIPLRAIENIADDSLRHATNVEAKFDFVMNLTAELLEACVGARGKYEAKLQETEIALSVAKENKKSVEERKELSKKAYKALEKSVKDAETSYYQSLDSMPSGWEIISMNVVEGIGNAFVTFLSGISRMVTADTGESSTSKHALVSKTEELVASRHSMNDKTVGAYKTALLLKTYTDGLVESCITDGKLNPNLKLNNDRLIYTQNQFSNLLKDVSGLGGNKVASRVISLIEEGTRLVKDVKQFQQNLHLDEEHSAKLAERILSFHDGVSTFEVEGKTLLWSSPTEMRAPNTRVMPAVDHADGSAAQQHIQNTRFKVQQAAAQLEFVREKYDKACDNLQESSKKLADIIAELAKLDIQKIDFEKIRKTLIQGINALAEFRGQWAKLVVFFQMISNLIKCSMNTVLLDFKSVTEISQEHAIRGYPVSALKKDMLYQLAFQAAKMAHIVNMISDSYVKVSNNYLLDRIAGLGKLLGFDPATDAAEIRQERASLHQSCAMAQKEIKNLLQKQRREFDDRINNRIRKIKTELEQAFPTQISDGLTESRRKNAIEAGIQNARESEGYDGTRGLDPADFV